MALPQDWLKLKGGREEPRPFTVVLSYYENQGMLDRQLETFAAYDADLRTMISVVVVDDGSPRRPAVIRPCGLYVQLWRMSRDVRWNQDACRNLGAKVAPAHWLLLTDIDHLVPENTAGTLVWGKADKRCAYRFTRLTLPGEVPYKAHPNTWFMRRELFDLVGGYDERFAGWYGTDGDFAGRVNAAALSIDQRPEPVVRVPREVIPDASTTTYARKTDADREAIARIKQERGLIPDWRPLRYLTPAVKVGECST